jgi:catechol 1,2-dioxygenase
VSRSEKLFQVEATGYKSITTQIFDRDSKYLDDDSVFAVKDGLTVEFTGRKGDPEAALDLNYDIAMAPVGEEGQSSAPLASSAAIK